MTDLDLYCSPCRCVLGERRMFKEFKKKRDGSLALTLGFLYLCWAGTEKQGLGAVIVLKLHFSFFSYILRNFVGHS
jgi:hypothetical protein